VELVVAIGIIAILSVASFVSYSGYNVDARDSARKADLGVLKVNLKTTKQKNGFFPKVTGSSLSLVRSTQASLVVATQGYIRQDLALENSSSRVYTDPKNSNYLYLYSTTRSGQEYQIGMTLENGGGTPSALVDGEYRSVIALLPSILVASSGATFDIDQPANQAAFILNGSTKNLPYDMKGVMQKTATTSAEALGSSGYLPSSTYTSCQAIYDSGRSVGSGSYYIRDAAGALTQTGCVMAY
jgi:type II secretory pathway pseudopilin PulG